MSKLGKEVKDQLWGPLEDLARCVEGKDEKER